MSSEIIYTKVFCPGQGSIFCNENNKMRDGNNPPKQSKIDSQDILHLFAYRHLSTLQRSILTDWTKAGLRNTMRWRYTRLLMDYTNVGSIQTFNDLNPEGSYSGGEFTLKVTPQDLDPFDVLGWYMLKPSKKQPTSIFPYYLTNKVIDDRNIAFPYIMTQLNHFCFKQKDGIALR